MSVTQYASWHHHWYCYLVQAQIGDCMCTCMSDPQEQRFQAAYFDAVQAEDESSGCFSTTGAQEVTDNFALPAKTQWYLGGVRPQPLGGLLQQCSETFARLQELKDDLPRHEDDTITESDGRRPGLAQRPSDASPLQDLSPLLDRRYAHHLAGDVEIGCSHARQHGHDRVKDESSMAKRTSDCDTTPTISDSQAPPGRVLAAASPAKTMSHTASPRKRDRAAAGPRAASDMHRDVLPWRGAMKVKVQAPAGQGAAKTIRNTSRFTPEFGKSKPKKQAKAELEDENQSHKKAKVRGCATSTCTHSQNAPMMLVCTAANCDVSECVKTGLNCGWWLPRWCSGLLESMDSQRRWTS
jgi:hypothetical protein